MSDVDLRTAAGREAARREAEELQAEIERLRAQRDELAAENVVPEPVDLTNYHQEIVNHFAREKTHLPFPLEDFLDAMRASGFDRAATVERRRRIKYDHEGRAAGEEYYEVEHPWVANTANYAEALLHAAAHVRVAVG